MIPRGGGISLAGGRAILVSVIRPAPGARVVGVIREYHGDRPAGERVGAVLERCAHRHLGEAAALACGRELAVEFHRRGRVERDAARRARLGLDS